MHATYGDEIEFLMVYIREAHALDSPWPMGGKDGAPIVEDPVTYGERKDVAQRCMQALDMSPMTMLIDGIDNEVGDAYAAWPDRLYLVDEKGKVAYAGGPGPFAFEPDELEDAIRAELDLEPIKRKPKKKGK